MTCRLQHLMTVAVAGGLSLAATAAAADEPILGQFPPGEEICYGRAYDQAYLDEHKLQKVNEIYLYRSLTDDPQAESFQQTKAARAEENVGWEKQSRQSDIESGAKPEEAGHATLSVLVHLRDRPLWYNAEVTCSRGGKGGFGCYGDCDGGAFKVTPKEGTQSLYFELDPSGLSVNSSCGEESEEGSGLRLEPGADDKLFRLDPQPMTSCSGAQVAWRPSWAQTAKPLRARLTENAKLCFGKAANAPAGVSGVTLRTVSFNPGDSETMPSLKAELTARLAKGGTVSKKITCYAMGYSFDCSEDVAEDEESKGGFKLERHGDNGIIASEPFGEDARFGDLLGLTDGKRIGPITLEDQADANCTP